MAHLHITTVDGNPVLMETATQAVPGQVNISKAKWDNAEVASGQLRKFWDSVKEKVEVKKEETPEQEKTRKKAVEELDVLAEDLQKEVPVFAYLIDRVSDQLEGK